GDKTASLTLSNPRGGGTMGNQNSATLTIKENDVGGTVQFSDLTYGVNENRNTATITVMRTGGDASGVSIDNATSNGTATAGPDYTATSGTLTFDSKEKSKSFTIPIVDDLLHEDDETVNL